MAMEHFEEKIAPSLKTKMPAVTLPYPFSDCSSREQSPGNVIDFILFFFFVRESTLIISLIKLHDHDVIWLLCILYIYDLEMIDIHVYIFQVIFLCTFICNSLMIVIVILIFLVQKEIKF